MRAKVRSAASRLCLLTVFVVALAFVPVSEAGAWEPGGSHQDNFTYCFNGTVPSARMPSFRRGINSWKQRRVLTTTEVSCSNSGALTVRQQSIDGKFGVLAEVHFNILANPVDVTYDSAEVWHDATSLPPSTAADAWSVSTHEVGHIWGLNHSCDSCLSPQNEYNSINTFARVYNADGQQGSEGRDLTSDDEAGLGWAKDGSWVPNPGFERTSDSSSTVRTVSDYYWTVSGWTRVCGDGGAQEGSCYLKLSGTGSFSTRAATASRGSNKLSRITVMVANLSSSNGALRVVVKDISTGAVLNGANQSCTVLALSAYTACTSSWVSDRSGRNLYEFAFFKDASGPTLKVDNVQIDDIEI